MIWGCITSKAVGRLKFISSTVKAERYINALEQCLKNVVKDNFQQTQNHIIQQDCPMLLGQKYKYYTGLMQQ
jgi:hypothetical protein